MWFLLFISFQLGLNRGQYYYYTWLQAFTGAFVASNKRELLLLDFKLSSWSVEDIHH